MANRASAHDGEKADQLESVDADHPETRARSASEDTVAPVPAQAESGHREAESGDPSAAAVAWNVEVPGYDIVDELGRGGMGVVYRARDTRLGRDVALKMMSRAADASPSERARFANEAELVAQFKHPNIVPIYDVSQWDERPYFSLEFVEGGSLADRLQGRPQDPTEAANLIATLADAVQYAHDRGVIHRDLKPANVLLTADGTPKLTDFGLAKRLEAESSQTKTGEIMGTPSYMAPEQAGGVTKKLGPACDVYALGALLYEMLTGRPPFRGRDPIDTVMMVLSNEPIAPRQLDPKIPRDLETICLKCLEKSPNRRYASARELASDLRRHLAGEPIVARPVSILERGRKWARRRPSIAALLAVSILAAATLIIGGTIFNVRLNKAYNDTARSLTLAQANLEQAQDAVDRMLAEIGIDQLAPVPESERLRRRMLASALAICQGLVDDNPNNPRARFQQARAQRQVADIRQLLGENDEARRLYSAAIDTLSTDKGADGADVQSLRELAAARNNYGNLLQTVGDYASAADQFRAAISVFDSIATSNPEELEFSQLAAAARGNLGLVEWRRRHHDEAVGLLERSVTDLRQLGAQSDPSTASGAEIVAERAVAESNLGTVLQSRGDFDAALAAFRAATDGFDGIRQAANDGNGDVRAVSDRTQYRFAAASARYNVAATMAFLTDANQELTDATFRAAVDSFDQLVTEFPETRRFLLGWGQARAAYASLLSSRDTRDEAEALLNEARDVLASAVERSPEDPEFRHLLATTLVGLSDLWSDGGTGPRAQLALEEALAIRLKLEQEFPDRAEYAHGLGHVLHSTANVFRQRRQPNEARRYLDRAIEVQEHAIDSADAPMPYRMELRRHCQSLAEVLIELGEPAAAARVAERLAAIIPDDWQGYYDAAGLLATCIPVATLVKDIKENDVDGKPLDEHCTDRALSLLEAARQHGLAANTELHTDEAFEPLRENPAFLRLLDESNGAGANAVQ